MSSTKTLGFRKIAIVASLTLLTIPVCMSAMNYTEATTLERKLAFQRPDISPIVRTMKLSTLAEVEIQRSTEVVPGSDFILTSKLRIERVMPRVRWEWSLPRGIMALTPTSGVIEEGGNSELSIQLRHTSASNARVTLNIYTMDANPHVIASGAYNTLNQDKINEELTALKERQAKYIEENPEVSRDDSEPKPDQDVTQ